MEKEFSKIINEKVMLDNMLLSLSNEVSDSIKRFTLL